MTTVLVTGTDTGVGKTRVTVSLGAALVRSGVSVGVMKPCETGIDPELGPARDGEGTAARFASGSDAALLAAAVGCTDDAGDVRPYAFPLPAAPSVAARAAGATIDPAQLMAAHDRLAARHELVLLEGAGGLLVPLARGFGFADLARELRAGVLVVARTGLGTVNHTALTVGAVRAAGLPLIGVVLNSPDGPVSASDRRNLESLADVDEVPVLAEFPHAGEPSAGALAVLVERVLGRVGRGAPG